MSNADKIINSPIGFKQAEAESLTCEIALLTLKAGILHATIENLLNALVRADHRALHILLDGIREQARRWHQ